MGLSSLIPTTMAPFYREGISSDADLSQHILRYTYAKRVYCVAVNGNPREIKVLRQSERTHILKIATVAIPLGKKGIGGMTTEDLVKGEEAVKHNGVDDLLIFSLFEVIDYRNFDSEKSIVKTHFEKIMEQMGLSMTVILYSDNDGYTYLNDVLFRLIEIPNIVEIKFRAAKETSYAGIWESLSKHTSVMAANDSPECSNTLFHGANWVVIEVSVIDTMATSELVISVMESRNLMEDLKLQKEVPKRLVKIGAMIEMRGNEYEHS